MIEINGKQYELKYNMKRIELIENVTGVPLMSAVHKNGGMLSIANLKVYVAYALREVGADALLDIKDGMKLAEKLLENSDFVTVSSEVLEALQRDCPFFFPAD